MGMMLCERNETMSERVQQPSLEEFFYGAVTIGERGQVVIPAEARKQHHLQAGDKLLVFRHPHLPGVVLARLDDMQALLDELQQWTVLVSGVRDDEADADTAGRAE